MTAFVTILIPALEIFGTEWDLAHEIYSAIYNMADDNEFGDEISEAILDIGYRGDFVDDLYEIVEFDESNLEFVDVRNRSTIELEYTIPVTINL